MTSSALNYTPEALAVAQRVVYELSGRRVVWPALTTTETFKVSRSPVLRLSGTPVIDIESVGLVSSTGEFISNIEFQLLNKSRIRVSLNYSGSSHVPGAASAYGKVTNCFECDRLIEVTYSYGARPPADMIAGIEELASQYTLMLSDQPPTIPGCSLPPNAKSVSTRGMSIELEDTDEILSQGKTGIDSLDNAIARYNMIQARSRSRLVSPTFPPSIRSNTHTRA